MFVVMGGTGHVGSSVAHASLDAGEKVTIVARRADTAVDLGAKGALIAVADVTDVETLRAAFRQGRRAFLLNPPGDTSKDSDAIERHQVANILSALEGSGLEKVVAASVSGAPQGERIGDLGVLWELEQGLRAQPIPAAINRGGYYMSNWVGQRESVGDSGAPVTMFPADLAIPMVAPADLGAFAAKRLLSSQNDVGPRSVQGPERYSSHDVANAFAAVLGCDVRVVVTPSGQWKEAFRDLGFSEESAESYRRMTEITVEQGGVPADDPWRGSTTLGAYIHALVARQSAADHSEKDDV